MTFDDFSNWDPGPLEPGERLFIDSGEYREMATIDYSLTEARYIVSYREAGDVLTTHICRAEYPTCWCSRFSSPTDTGLSWN
jgi:hypothetical protein